MSRNPEVLFVCVHNAGRSQMAAALLQHHARGRVSVRSAGSAPAETINPAVLAVMAELGLDLSDEVPEKLSTDAVEAADIVITMGCGDACPVFPGKRYLDWELTDPAGKGVDEVREVRDEIDRRVRGLLAELEEPDVTIRPMTEADWPAVREIYELGIATGHATFETAPPSWDDFDSGKLAGHRHVAIDRDGKITGWIACSAVSSRCVYAGVVEHSVYVHPEAAGRGVGRLLLDALIASTEQAGIWTIQSGIFPENRASLALHRAAGFRDVGTRHRLGLMTYGPCAGQWRDVVTLERRSTIAGI